MVFPFFFNIANCELEYYNPAYGSVQPKSWPLKIRGNKADSGTHTHTQVDYSTL